MKIGGFELRAGVGCFKRRKARLHNSLEGGAEGAALGMAKNRRTGCRPVSTNRGAMLSRRLSALGVSLFPIPRAAPSAPP
jgi:hypothetical protein